MIVIFFFFFSSRRRHTRYWRDWSSDVCSSDLEGDGGAPLAGGDGEAVAAEGRRRTGLGLAQSEARLVDRILSVPADRKSVVLGKRVDLGGRRIIKKNKK